MLCRFQATRREVHNRHLEETLEFYRAPFSGQLLRATCPVLVMFWAERDGPSRMVLPLIDDAAADYVGRLAAARHNIDRGPATRAQHDVTGLPTLTLFKGAPRPAVRSELSARASWSSGSTPAADTPPRQDLAAPGAAHQRHPSAPSSEPGPGRLDKPRTCWRGLA
ncbi:thioredoxin family protein [Streptomyces griseus]|uniref:thioredoxin family protein n=1 Tax=Streptomyces griseus TaxID=1911 RepID=UPI003807936B